MIRIPDTPDVRPATVPGAPVNPAAAAAPARALGSLAQSVAGVGAPFAQLAGQIQNTENLHDLSTARNRLTEERANHLLALEQINDPAERIERTNAFLQKARPIIDDERYAPAVRDQLVPWFDKFATDTRTGVAADAARLSQQRAINAAENERIRAFQTNDLDALEQSLTNSVQAGVLTPEEAERERIEFDDKQERDLRVREIHHNPAHWLETHEQPAPHQDAAEFYRHQALAERLLLSETADTVDEIQDLIAAGEITAPEQLDAFAETLRPTALEVLKNDLRRRADARYEEVRRSPEFQAQVIGEASRLLAEYRPGARQDHDAQYVQIDGLLRQIPDSAAKSELQRRLTAIRNDEWSAIDDSAGYARQQLDDAFKGGLFGEFTREQSTAAAIGSGVLRDFKKLRTAGFSEKQAKKISKEKNASDQRDLFQELWPQREETDEYLSPFLRATYEAIVKGDSRIEYIDPTGQESALRAYGEAKAKLETWLAANPTATQEQIEEQLYRIASPHDRRAFLDAIFTTRPGILPPLEGDPNAPQPEIGLPPTD